MSADLNHSRNTSVGAGAAAAPQRNFSFQLERAVERGVRWLLSAQSSEGFWWGELEADTTLESDYIFFLHVIGRGQSAKIAKLAGYIRARQLPEGGWNVFPGGPPELNATVKAWVALRIAGDAAGSPHLQRAKQKIHELGGLESTNSYVRMYLAMAGAIDPAMAPAIPPELMLLPYWFPLNIIEMSSWTRGIVIPMSIVAAMRPNWRLPEGVTVDELFTRPGAKPKSLSWDGWLISWKNVFLALDRAVKLYERTPWKPFRRMALQRAHKWMIERLERSEGLATIFPAMTNSIFALLAEGGDTTDPLISRELHYLESYEIEVSDGLRIQPCISPVWDTAIVMVALEEAGVDPADTALVKAAAWLLDNQILGPGDWQVKNRKAEPGGWAFEFLNDWYPDVDDTAFVLMALRPVADGDPDRMRAAIRRGLAWLLSMQNSDGGWGAFDHQNDRQFLNNIPFADHNAMLDPSTSDVTARALECLGLMGWPADDPAIARARGFLRREQTREGAWYGRWGVNYIYGTSGVLRALEAAGLRSSPESKRGGEWLRAVQNEDGSFGESILSYYDESLKGRGRSTASQTAWGLIGLLASAGPDDPAAQRAAAWLVSRQNEDGSWDEDEFTGTGFPCVFYLKYHLYRNSFPLYALARYDNLRKGRATLAGTRVGADEVRKSYGSRL
ncbi:MAG: squalene--hopene cyclase [Acidobacteriota bacterium]|nr:squalene--hopene cyclase [Acidobacteriota bacterium]